MTMSISRLTNRIWYTHPVEAGDRPTLGLVAGSNASILIDGGNSPAHVHELLQYANDLNISPIKALCLTHWHWDHTFGAESTKLPVIAYSKTKEKLDWMRLQSWTDEDIAARVEQGTEMEFCRQNILIEWPQNDRNIKIPHPTITFSDSIELDLGEINAEILPIESDHTSDCCIVFIKQEKTVFLGDCLYLNMDSEPWFRTAKNTRAMLKKLIDLNADWYIPAHHEIYSGEGFRKFAFELLMMCDAAEDAYSLFDAEENMKKLIFKELSDDQRQGLKEFINAKERARPKICVNLHDGAK